MLPPTIENAGTSFYNNTNRNNSTFSNGNTMKNYGTRPIHTLSPMKQAFFVAFRT